MFGAEKGRGCDPNVYRAGKGRMANGRGRVEDNKRIPVYRDSLFLVIKLFDYSELGGYNLVNLC
ncbi:hypothetical protein J31TS6_44390 [Brevibacillus reuszeri]|nr:hypothetical protein J31TS6_44390 [Brevibacillus reuszeri]